MKKSTLSLITLLAVSAACHASVTARPVAVSVFRGEISVGNAQSLVVTDGNRLSYRATANFISSFRYSSIVTLFNPLLAVGTFNRMVIKVEGRTTAPNVPLNVSIINRTGPPTQVGVQFMSTVDKTYTFALTGNVRRFIEPNQLVHIGLGAFSQQPFAHRFDEVTVTFS